MEKLIASKNNISELPADLWKMRGLEFLDLSDNLLASLPESIAKLPSIKELKIDINKIGSFPTAVQTLQQKGIKIEMHSQDQTKQKRYMEQSIAGFIYHCYFFSYISLIRISPPRWPCILIHKFVVSKIFLVFFHAKYT